MYVQLCHLAVDEFLIEKLYIVCEERLGAKRNFVRNM